MEDPYRTMSPEEPYSEQVVLLDGQGIWYSKFRDLEDKYYMTASEESVVRPSTLWTYEDFGLSEENLQNKHMYLCAQSLFKLAPEFDLVVRDVLLADLNGVVIFTKGRRPRWTDTFKERLLESLGLELYERVVFIERVSSTEFPNLIKLADVMLHPFPFGGSRTR